MSTPKPGQIRCPTCHRSTPPAAFCTQCGSPIPPSALRGRGMDRAELDERLRSRRGEGPYRRGGFADEWQQPGRSPWAQPYEPEPEDVLAAQRAADAEQVRVDHSAEELAPAPPVEAPPPAEAAAPWRRGSFADDERATAPITREEPPAEPVSFAERRRPTPEEEAPPAAVEEHAEEERAVPPAYAAAAEPPRRGPAVAPRPDYLVDEESDWDEDRYAYVPPYAEERSSGGGGPLMVLGFLALGVIALIGGAVLSGVLGGNGAAIASPTATVVVTASPTPLESVVPTPAASGTPQGSANASEGPPIVFPDGFTAEAQPCAEQPTSANGCDSSGAENDGNFWIWIGFTKGKSDDVVGIKILDASGGTAGEASLELSEVRCQPGQVCSGWMYFGFQGLAPGDYKVRVNRNGLPAAETTLTVVG